MGCGASKASSKADRWGGAEGSRVTVYGRRDLPDDLKDFELRAKAEEIFILVRATPRANDPLYEPLLSSSRIGAVPRPTRITMDGST